MSTACSLWLVAALLVLQGPFVSCISWSFTGTAPNGNDARSSLRSGAAIVTTSTEIIISGGQLKCGGGATGCVQGAKYENDVWASATGASWSARTVDALWPSRGYHTMEYISDSTVSTPTILLAMGTAGNALVRGDIWKSTDSGSTWTYVTDPRFADRADAAMRYFTTTSKLYVIGGSEGSNFLKDVWQSDSTATTWTLLTNAAFAGRIDPMNAVIGGYMWIAGGEGLSGFLRDVWKSADGTTWTQATEQAAWDAASGLYNMVSVGGRLTIVGGSTSSAGGTNSTSVWASADGATWAALSTSAPWTARTWPVVTNLASSNTLVMIGGYSNIEYLNDIWSTAYSALVWGDPHFVGFRGQHYDVAGFPDKIFNWYSDVDIQINAHIFLAVNSTQATYIAAVGIRLGRYIKLRFRVHPEPRFSAFPHKKVVHPEFGRILALDECGYAKWVESDRLFIQWQQYRITLIRRAKKLDFAAPFSFINIELDGLPTSMEMVHGLWGQSWRMNSTVHSTTKQGEGVIEGTVDDYVVSTLLGSDFKFNRYLAKPGQKPAGECQWISYTNATGRASTM